MHDEQLFAFLHTLVRHPEDLAQVVSDFTNPRKNFFVFNLYFEVARYVQPYLVAVDDFVPVNSDGSNLFCQFDKGVNVLLPLIEKCWDKYVYLGELRKSLLGRRYIERVMLAFLGAPSVRLKTQSRRFFDRFAATWFKGSYSYAYLAGAEKEERDLPVSCFIPMLVVDLVQTRRCASGLEAGSAGGEDSQESVHLFVLQAYDDSNVKSQAFVQNFSEFEATKHLTGAADSRDGCTFYVEASKFCEAFDEVFVCTYKRNCKINHFNIGTAGVASLETNRFEELFLSFKVCVNDEVSLTVTQNHTFKKDPATGKEPSSKLEENNPPVRVVLARKPIYKNLFDLKTRDALETNLASAKEKGQVNLNQRMHDLNLKGFEAVVKSKHPDGKPPQADLDSDYDSSDGEEAKPQAQNFVPQKKQRRLLDDQPSIFTKLADAATVARNGLGLDPEVTEDLKYDDLFKALTREYRNDLKYVCGFGQTREETIHLR